jgi:glycosyltransferase involved in cell wall biosynthesis
MAPGPDISIVVCTYNRATSLRRTLEALDAQETPTAVDWELLVIDNNSTDGTRRVVENFAGTAGIRMRYVFVPRQGLSHARNAGIGHSQGAVIGFTDDDVEPARDWVGRIAAVIGERDADVVGGRILPAWRTPPPRWLDNRPFFHGPLSILDHETAAEVLDPHAAPTVWGANMAFRREVFAKVGLFDTRRGLIGSKLYGGEELELIGRALAAGCRVVYDPTIVVRHCIGPERMRVAYLSRLYFERAECEALVQPPVTTRALLGVPLYRYRSVADRTWAWLVAAVRRRPGAIERWLECCAALGFMWGVGKRLGRGRRSR